MNRRDFFSTISFEITKYIPIIGIIGLKYHPYTFGPVAGYSGWITWFGRLIMFVESK